MKDNDLAAAQQRLAQAPGAPATGTPWYWLGLPLLLIVAAAAWLLRRRKPSPLPPLREDSDAAALAAAVPAGAGLDAVAEQASWSPLANDGGRLEPAMPAWATDDAAAVDGPDIDPRPPVSWDTVEQRHDDAEAVPAAVAEPPRWDDALAAPGPDAPAHDALPTEVGVPEYALQAEQQPQFRGVFDLPDEAHSPAPDAPEDAAPTAGTDSGAATDSHDWAPRIGQERLELAIAYLDLGDAQTARTLLLEVAEGGDAHCQAQARELLARLD